MKVQADTPPFTFSDIEQFMLEAIAFGDRRMELGIGLLELGGPLLHSHLKFVMGSPQAFLRAAPFDELANFAPNGCHHIQQARVVLEFSARKKFESADKFPGALNRKGHCAAQACSNTWLTAVQVPFVGPIADPDGAPLIPYPPGQTDATRPA